MFKVPLGDDRFVDVDAEEFAELIRAKMVTIDGITTHVHRSGILNLLANRPWEKPKQRPRNTRPAEKAVAERGPEKGKRTGAKRGVKRGTNKGVNTRNMGAERITAVLNDVLMHPGTTASEAAKRLSVRREVVYKPLKKLMAEGKISKDGARFYVVDAKGGQ
jgi:hypothetical protein